MDKWILCSEKLPEKSKNFVVPNEQSSAFVLVTIKGQTYPYGEDKVRIARYSYTYNEWSVAHNNFGKVVAWMPLPKPYGMEEKDNV